MHIDKARKRIAKQVKKGFRGYPVVTLAYSGPTPEKATDVVVTYTASEEAEPQRQPFSSERDVRYDESIQSVLLKIIERAGASSVVEIDGVAIKR